MPHTTSRLSLPAKLVDDSFTMRLSTDSKSLATRPGLSLDSTRCNCHHINLVLVGVLKALAHRQIVGLGSGKDWNKNSYSFRRSRRQVDNCGASLALEKHGKHQSSHVSLRVDIYVYLTQRVPDRVLVKKSCLCAADIINQNTHIRR